MSSEETDVDLPVAAYEWRYVDWMAGHTTLRHEEPDRSSFDVELELVDELVTKSDAKEAIKETRRTKEMYFTQVILEAEQRGIVSADQAQKINDLRDELEEEVDES